MTTYAQTIVNPGAEAGDTSGWAVRSGDVSSTTASPNSGLRCFRFGNSGTFVQELAVDASLYSAIDHGQVEADLSGYHIGGSSSLTGHLMIEFYSIELALLDTIANADSSPTAWTLETLSAQVPSGTRTIVIGASATSFSGLGGTKSSWDDFTLDLVDSGVPDLAEERAHQAVAYALVSQPADQLRGHQLAVLSVNAAEESSGQYLMNAHQVVAYALVKGKAERVDLRAWTFLQDDHLFYGLQLGSGGTIVHDMLTRQWCQWSSPGKDYWRVEDAVDWEGYNLGCDTENGTIWKIDPTGRLDEGTTVITSQVTGQATVRGRRAVPCYTAELACSQAEPAAATGTSIQLRTSDDASQSWVNHGTVDGEATGTRTLFRWYGLGLLTAPGRVFELTNVGYARRIDGLDIEVGGAQ